MLATLMVADPPAARRRFRPRIVPTLAAIAGVTLFVSAGLWQRDRMEQKLALRAQLDAAAARAPEPLPGTTDWVAWRFRPVTASGTFDAARQILIDNRIHGGQAGYYVVTPLVLADGRTVLVNRGWIAGRATRAELPAAPTPTGAVDVRGRVNVPASAYVELRRDTIAGPVWQNLDVQRFAEVTGVRLLPVVIEQTAPLSGTDTLVRDWPEPDLGVDKHRIYMVQWFIFAAMVAGLWGWFTLRRKR